MNKLKNCPFCGGEAAYIITNKISDVTGMGFGLRIQCKKCNLSHPKTETLIININEDGSVRYIKDGRTDLANKWNTRNDANKEDDEVNIPDRITLNPDSIKSGSLNFETKMYEECPVVIEGTHDQDYSIR